MVAIANKIVDSAFSKLGVKRTQATSVADSIADSLARNLSSTKSYSDSDIDKLAVSTASSILRKVYDADPTGTESALQAMGAEGDTVADRISSIFIPVAHANPLVIANVVAGVIGGVVYYYGSRSTKLLVFDIALSAVSLEATAIGGPFAGAMTLVSGVEWARNGGLPGVGKITDEEANTLVTSGMLNLITAGSIEALSYIVKSLGIALKVGSSLTVEGLEKAAQKGIQQSEKIATSTVESGIKSGAGKVAGKTDIIKAGIRTGLSEAVTISIKKSLKDWGIAYSDEAVELVAKVWNSSITSKEKLVKALSDAKVVSKSYNLMKSISTGVSEKLSLQAHHILEQRMVKNVPHLFNIAESQVDSKISTVLLNGPTHAARITSRLAELIPKTKYATLTKEELITAYRIVYRELGFESWVDLYVIPLLK
jgi:hypothetical protein